MVIKKIQFKVIKTMIPRVMKTLVRMKTMTRGPKAPLQTPDRQMKAYLIYLLSWNFEITFPKPILKSTRSPTRCITWFKARFSDQISLRDQSCCSFRTWSSLPIRSTHISLFEAHLRRSWGALKSKYRSSPLHHFYNISYPWWPDFCYQWAHQEDLCSL